MNILIIEDDLALSELYLKFLTHAGHNVELSADGWQGFKEGGTGDYQLIITDLNMPNWDGVTSIKSILELNPNLNFIVVTGYPDSLLANKIKNIPQVKHIITKPLDFKILLNYINEL